MVYRVYVEKKEGLDNEARALLGEARSLLGIEGLEAVRLYNRYDAEGLSADLFEYAKHTVFAEPQLDNVSAEVTAEGATIFAACLPIALGGWLSAIFQGRVAAASINVVAKKPDDWSKGIILCGIVEFYAILSLLASVLLLMNAL